MKLALVMLAGLTASAHAETAGGWNLTPPAGWKVVEVNADHAIYQAITPPTFCVMTVVSPRAISGAVDEEVVTEWKTLLAEYTTANVKPVGTGIGTTRAGLPFKAIGATITDREKHVLAGRIYVVLPPSMLGSVFVAASGDAAMTHCEPTITGVLDSMTVAKAAPAPAPESRPAPTSGPLPISGAWGTSVAGQPNDGTPTVRRQYVFGTDGTYRYHSESWGGAYRSDEYMLIDERGTFAITGDQFTIAPTAATRTFRSAKAIKKTEAIALEKVTYKWQTHFFEGIKETDLILTPRAKTARDGEFASNDQFPNSYLLANTYHPEWKFPP